MSHNGTSKPIEVMLVAEYSLFRESLGRLLSGEPDLKVAAHCATVIQGLEILKQQAIDVVLLEFNLAEQWVGRIMDAVRRGGLKSKVLLLAADSDGADAGDLLRAGVCGIFQKHDPAALLGHAIRDVAAGKLWFSQEQLQRALNRETGFVSKSLNNEELTEREKRVLSLVSSGLKNREIGAQIGVSEGSVKVTIQQLFSKFGVRSRSLLVRIALAQDTHS